MYSELIFYITKYGYLGIFILVFLQEIGAPNPIPNELVLMFSGYLTFTGVLKLPLVILSALSADFIGACILHMVFYFFGHYILQQKPKWMPLQVDTINKLINRLSPKGLKGIYMGRMTPFIRGYTSVISGLLQIRHRVFLPIALITATIWSGTYAITGRLLGPFWNLFIANIGSFKYIMLSVFLAGILFFSLSLYIKFILSKTNRSK